MSSELDMHLSRVRPLTSADKNLFLKFIEPRLEELQKANVKVDAYLQFLYMYFDDADEKHVIFGYFDEEKELQSTIGFAHWPALPYATLNFMIIRKTSEAFNAHRNGLVYCLHKCLELGEDQGIRTFFSMQKARTIKHKEKTWRQYDTPVVSRYYTTLEYLVPAGTEPPYAIVWQLMDRQTWPHDLHLWATRLKPEYEKVINWGGKLSPIQES